MARLKRKSRALEAATTRRASVKSISPTLDLGGGVSVAAYEKKMSAVESALGAYNMILSQVDEKLNELQAAEKELRDFSVRVLDGVAARYGEDSDEYEQAGGKRRSERKRPRRTKPAGAK